MHERAAKIKLLILDIDGVLTDGQLYYNKEGEAMKSFHARDGLGIRLLLENGVQVAIITGRESELVAKRAKELGIPFVYQGRVNKLEALNELMLHLNLDFSELAMMGDDIIDLPILTRVGFASCPKDAHEGILKYVHFVANKEGGQGAVRELVDLILVAQDKLLGIIERTLETGEVFARAKSSC